jgi:MerR family transcriptional regulator, light-induced transcriptional regulator
MAQDQDEAHGMPHMKPDYQGASQGKEVNFFPPLLVPVDAPELRYAKLSKVVAEQVVPRLLALHEQARGPEAATSPAAGLPRTADIEELAKLVLGSNDEEAVGFVLGLKDGGVSLDSLHMELLEPTARHLGELWNQDHIDFVDVTLGVARLQRLVHVFEGLDDIPNYDEKRKVLLATAPGEQHSLGSTIVQKFLRAAGWHVWTYATPRLEDAADIAAKEWIGVVGFSLSSDLHVDSLSQIIARVRQASLNPKVGIMVGGSAIARNPDWVQAIGADGTAANGPAAVILAKKLLAASLV